VERLRHWKRLGCPPVADHDTSHRWVDRGNRGVICSLRQWPGRHSQEHICRDVDNLVGRTECERGRRDVRCAHKSGVHHSSFCRREHHQTLLEDNRSIGEGVWIMSRRDAAAVGQPHHGHVQARRQGRVGDRRNKVNVKVLHNHAARDVGDDGVRGKTRAVAADFGHASRLGHKRQCLSVGPDKTQARSGGQERAATGAGLITVHSRHAVPHQSHRRQWETLWANGENQGLSVPHADDGAVLQHVADEAYRLGNCPRGDMLVLGKPASPFYCKGKIAQCLITLFEIKLTCSVVDERTTPAHGSHCGRQELCSNRDLNLRMKNKQQNKTICGRTRRTRNKRARKLENGGNSCTRNAWE
jgi:hypothetical protein